MLKNMVLNKMELKLNIKRLWKHYNNKDQINKEN